MFTCRYKLQYYKVGVEKDRDSIFTTIWKPGLVYEASIHVMHAIRAEFKTRNDTRVGQSNFKRCLSREIER